MSPRKRNYKKERVQIFQQITSIVVQVFTTLITILILGFAVLTVWHKYYQPQKNTMPVQFINLISGSMNPTIPIRSLVVIKEIDPDKLQKGDVITFRVNKTQMVTHRISRIIKPGLLFRTKGDANNQEDNIEITSKKIVGKVVFSNEILGIIALGLKSPNGIIALVLTICWIYLVGLLIRELSKYILQNKEEKNNV